MATDAEQAAAWNSAINSVNNSINTIATSSIGYKTRQWNEKMINQQREWALADWNMQNQYNSPQAQMERLKAAGLNPNLVYGKGADVVANTMPRSTDSPSWNPPAPHQSKDNGIMDYISLKNAALQTDNLQAQNSVLLQEAALKKAQAMATLSSADLNRWDLSWKNENHDLNQELLRAELNNRDLDFQAKDIRNQYLGRTMDANLEQTLQQIAESKARTGVSEQQVKNMQEQLELMKKDGKLRDFEMRLNEQGVTKNDEIYWRVVATLLNKMGFNFGANR